MTVSRAAVHQSIAGTGNVSETTLRLSLTGAGQTPGAGGRAQTLRLKRRNARLPRIAAFSAHARPDRRRPLAPRLKLAPACRKRERLTGPIATPGDGAHLDRSATASFVEEQVLQINSRRRSRLMTRWLYRSPSCSLGGDLRTDRCSPTAGPSRHSRRDQTSVPGRPSPPKMSGCAGVPALPPAHSRATV